MAVAAAEAAAAAALTVTVLVFVLAEVAMASAVLGETWCNEALRSLFSQSFLNAAIVTVPGICLGKADNVNKYIDVET